MPLVHTKQLALIVDDVIYIYHHEVWQVYNVNCYLLPITKIMALDISNFIQLNLLKLAPCEGHLSYCGWISAPREGHLRHHG